METQYVVLAFVSLFALAIWFYTVVNSKDFPRMTDEEIAAGDKEFQDSLSDVATPDEYTPAPKNNKCKLTIAIEKVKEATEEESAKPKKKRNITTKKKPVQKVTGKPRSRKKKGS